MVQAFMLNVNIVRAFMPNVEIVQAFMLNVNIVQAFMLNVNIVQVFMLNVNIVRAFMPNVEIVQAFMLNVNIVRAFMPNVEIVQAFMLNVNIVQAFMLNVNIVQAFMLNVNMVQAFMLNVNMVQAFMLNVKMAKAFMLNVNIVRDFMPNVEIVQAFMLNVNIVRAFMPNVEIVQAFMLNVNIVQAFMLNVNIVQAFMLNMNIVQAFMLNVKMAQAFMLNVNIVQAFMLNVEIVQAFMLNVNIVRDFMPNVEIVRAFMLNVNIVQAFMLNLNIVQAFMLNVNMVQALMLNMKTLEDKIADLEKKLEKKQADDELSEFERAKRDVKDEAAKGKVDIDVLHERLILLYNLARKQNHDLKDKINLILSKFHIHKNRPNFAAALVLKLVCNKEEEAVLDKEQKLLKTFGLNDVHSDNYNMQSHNFKLHEPDFMGGSFGQTQGHTYGMPPRFSGSPRRGRPRGNNHNLCFKCNKPGHFVRDCTATLDKFRLKPWEFNINLGTDPTSVTVRQPSFVNFENKIIDNDREVNSAEEVYSKATDGVSPDIRNVKFFNPKTFVAGQIHTRLYQWQKILPCSHSSDEILDWLVHGVNINKYIVHFKGDFWGNFYDDKFPPCRIFNNSNKCKKFSSFITETVMERLKNGSIECIGKVGLVKPPHIVAPLTVEPTKPRLCINLMYLNNWIKDIPFSLDTLKNVPQSVRENAYFTTIDDKSGFDNVSLSEDSRRPVGFQWGGFYFICKTLPFGFKLSSYIYHTLNLQATCYIRRKFLIPVYLYIDDRLIEEVRKPGLKTGFSCTLLANYIVCEVVTRLGYCINLDKTVFIPSQSVVFLGFVVDSVARCFRITE
ncbi:unnamed protein product [Mytilus coruscus]|uniref:CCHC-type domain-containing protein n=1 Tax=Mytilus coruscus TaxID=42192 RepID=A0A6J8CIP1_MYTCO|nr:unnamed protein product [Mytilus coruscus]